MSGSDGRDVDVEAVKNLYKSNPIAKAAFDYFKEDRRNNSRITKVDRLHNLLLGRGVATTRQEIIDFLRELETTRAGVFKVGRKGHPSRFEWDAPLTEVARAAIGQVDVVSGFTEEEAAELTEDDEAVQQWFEDLQALEHRYRLRRDFELVLRLPADLTAGEAARVADYIKTLPFS